MTTIEKREGPHRGLTWRVKQQEEDESTVNYREFGDISLRIVDSEYETDRGGVVLYTERHDSHERDDLDWYVDRAKSLIDQFHDDDNVKQCPACDTLYNVSIDHHRYERELTWSQRHIFHHGMDPRYRQTETREKSQTCVWTTGRVFDTMHMVTHLQETNPFFDDDELVACDSLVLTRGYDKTFPDEEPRSYEDIHEKYMAITRESPKGKHKRKKKKELLELLDWVLKREERYHTKGRFDHY